jgi:serine protease AprX
VAGDGTDSNAQFKGIAYGVNLIDLRVLDQNGVGSDSNVIAAIQRAIALKNTYNIRIINLSLGRPVYGGYATDPLCQAQQRGRAPFPLRSAQSTA